jgi:hypothetical protein
MNEQEAMIKGDTGEAITASTLRKQLKMRVIRNIYLEYRGKSVEIDMLGISSYGLFVIENKNYSGIVSGNEEKYWRVIYSNNREELLYNPVMQNETHILAVTHILAENNIKVAPKNCVIFNDNAKLFVGNNPIVKTLSDFVEFYELLYKTDEILDIDIQNKIYNLFKKYSDTSFEAKEVHKALIQETLKPKIIV